MSSSPPLPRHKRRRGICTPRAVGDPGPCPVMVQHYRPTIPCTASPVVTLPQLSAFQTSLERQSALTSIIPLILDTGASVTVTNCVDDFVTPPRPVQNTTLQGIASGLEVHGVGTVNYTVMNNEGYPVTITIAGTLYVPKCPS